MSALSTAELAIYALLCIPALYILFKHGKPGILGWLYLFFFCALRIIGGAMTLSGSKSASIIGNIGLSPLLLSLSGIIHEVRHYPISGLNKKMEWAIVILYHQFVIVAVILLAMGSSRLQGTSPQPSDLTLVKAGIALLAVAWVGLVVGAVITWFAFRPTASAHKLHWCAMFALIFAGIRVFYSLAALVTQKAYLNPSTGNLAIRVVLGTLPQLIAALLLLAGGLMSRNIKRQREGDCVPSSNKRTFV